MSVWFAIPSKRPPEEAALVLKLWRQRGYKIALLVDSEEDRIATSEMCDRALAPIKPCTKYPGYANAVNVLCKCILAEDPKAEWIVTGGDDVEPDPNHSAEEIAIQCSEHFAPCNVSWNGMEATFGVMQPTGDRWGDDAFGRARWPDAPAYIDRVCGSPWMGREFCRRMYGGQGPFFHGYHHMFVDEELQAVAKQLGVFWQRRDLIQFHRHWGRGGDEKAMPEFLREVSGEAHWAEASALFEMRRAGGFPGHEPIL